MCSSRQAACSGYLTQQLDRYVAMRHGRWVGCYELLLLLLLSWSWLANERAAGRPKRSLEASARGPRVLKGTRCQTLRRQAVHVSDARRRWHTYRVGPLPFYGP